MPIFTRTFQIVAGLLSIPVVGAAIIGSAYSSPFLTHLADITNGTQTSAVMSENAPNWSFGAPLAQVAGVSTATTTGTLASSTAFSVAVAAIDGTGTTTLSAAVTESTDANVGATDGLEITWGSVPGATGYAIFEATGTVSTASGFSQYFLATSTNGVPNASYTMATTTGSLSGSYTKSDTTAFSFKVNPLGTSYFDGGSIGIATTSPQAALDIASGTIRAYSVSTTTCTAAIDGSIFYNAKDKHLYVCEATVWQIIK